MVSTLPNALVMASARCSLMPSASSMTVSTRDCCGSSVASPTLTSTAGGCVWNAAWSAIAGGNAYSFNRS